MFIQKIHIKETYEKIIINCLEWIVEVINEEKKRKGEAL